MFLIVNPAAGRGRIHRILPEIAAAFRAFGIADIYQTSKPGEEATLAFRAQDAGAETIVVVGGDGTCSGIADSLIRSNSRCRLAVVAAGTGNDFAKTLGVEKYNAQQIAELVRRGAETRIDVGWADGHYFLNSCGFGFDASVLEASNKVRWIKGDAVYIYAALRQLFSYRGIEVRANGAPGVAHDSMLMVTASNGRWLGGAFQIAPKASVLDGRLDACFVSDSSVVERVKLFVGAMRGTHIGMPSVSSVSVQQMTLSFASAPSMEMDGELRVARARTVELRCVPRALSVVAAPDAIV